MQAVELAKTLSTYNLLSQRNSLVQTFSHLHLSARGVRGAAQYGVMETAVSLPFDEKGFYIEAEAFLSVLRTLPDKELDLELTPTALKWKCASSRGLLAFQHSPEVETKLDIPVVPETVVDEKFSELLALGAVAAGTTSLLAVGLFGVLLDNTGDNLRVYSSDNKTVASAVLGPKLKQGARAVLSPVAVKLLVAVTHEKPARVSFDAEGVYVVTPTRRLLLKQVPPLRHDIAAIANGYSSSEQVIKLDKAVVQTFVRRASLLAEQRGAAKVKISVDKGTTQLSFTEGPTQSEAFYLAEEATGVTVPPVEVDALALSQVLARTTEAVYDYAKDGVLILRNNEGFRYVIEGKRNQT